MASMERAGHLADVVAGAVTMADIRVGQGRLTDALTVLERGLALATASRPALRGVPNMHVGISDILRERDDLAGARRHLEAAADSGAESWFRQYPHRSRVVSARICQAEQDPAGALRLLDEAEAVYVAEFSPDVRPIAALRARVWIAEGELPRASAWAQERGLSAADPMTYLHEFEHATLARLLVAQGARDGAAETVREAIALADRLVVAAQEGGRLGSVIDALVGLALARHAGGDTLGAFEALGRAATLAAPEGHVRVFLDEGPAMAALLKEAARQPNAPEHVRRLHAGAREARGGPAAAQPLIEPLSDRELEVLRLLGTELDGPGIARELVVSLSTVRTHTKNIYAKLGVNNRRSAVRRAEELDLLSRTRS
jgi:LuxR family maltose regulon positive regulatory protein